MKYKIYQIKNIRDCDYAFRDWESAEHAFNINDYAEVYSGDVDDRWEDLKLLERLWVLFNVNHPSDYTGRSLSVSDVVEIDGYGYYCDSFGWRGIYGRY